MKFNKRYAFFSISVLMIGLNFTQCVIAEDINRITVAVVNPERIFKESDIAKTSQSKLQNEFAKREKELREDTEKIKSAAEKLDRDSAIMTDTQRTRSQKELTDADRELQRKQREFTEDVNQRSFEERSKIAQKANQALKIVAESKKIDLVVQEAAYVNSRIDITDDVIKTLNNIR